MIVVQFSFSSLLLTCQHHGALIANITRHLVKFVVGSNSKMKLKKSKDEGMKYEKRLKEIANEEMLLSQLGAPKPTVIHVGTDFGGIEGPIISLNRLQKKNILKFKHVYSSEANKKLQSWIRALSPGCVVDSDACNRVMAVPQMDAFMFCPPCQPYARGGKHGGIDDPRGGRCVSASLKLIKQKMPKLVICENSPQLLSRMHINHFLGVVRTLRSLGYRVFVKKINLAYFVAQRRERMYFVAIRANCFVCPFHWPRGSDTKILAEDTWYRLVRQSEGPPCKLPSHKRQKVLVKSCCTKIMKNSVDPRSVVCCIDIDCSLSHSTFAVNQHPTLTATRGQTGGAYITTTSTRPGIAALCAVQGYSYRHELQSLQQACSMSESELGKALGKSVTCSFVEQLWMRSLQAAGLI